MYLLGDAYLKTDQKANARNAFLFCASNSSYPAQKEISEFHYAKLSYELGYPDVALAEFRSFLEQYPNSTFAPEARELLLNVQANTSNYKDALALMDSVKNPSASARQLKARILYGRATELINDGMLLNAAELLDRASREPNNTELLPFINFWKGEIAYRSRRRSESGHGRRGRGRSQAPGPPSGSPDRSAHLARMPSAAVRRAASSAAFRSSSTTSSTPRLPNRAGTPT